MEFRQRAWLWLGFSTSAVWLTGLLTPLQASGVHLHDQLNLEALELERTGQWAEACDLYWQILKSDHGQPALRERYLVCLRHIDQERRHRDPAFRQAVVKYKFSEAIDIYGEVLAKVQASYIDKVDLAVLFDRGVQELRFALEEKAFVADYLANADPQKVRAFREHLEQWPGKVSSLDEARHQAQAIAQEALQELSLNPAVVLFELVCGACNGLDEYSAWLSPQQYREVQAGPKGELERQPVVVNSVEAVQLLEDSIGCMRVVSFEDGTVQDMRDALVQLQTQGMKVLILDLRGNRGGLFKAAVHSAGLFCPKE